MNVFDKQYHDLLGIVLQCPPRQTRNAIVRSMFTYHMSFDLRLGFPLLTTKKVYFKGIVEELLFFLRGERQTKILEDKGVNIWKGNTCSEFLNKCGLDYEEGDMGPMYGYVLRHDPDQLSMLIHGIINDPYSRRHLLTTYKPELADKGVLYPCHGLVIQFYVSNGGLDLHMYQRSCDVFLGLPFNIASYALLLTIISKVVNLTPGTVHITLGDVHIYESHVDQCMTQLSRISYEPCTIELTKELTGDPIAYIEGLEFSDISLHNYKSHPAIKANMVA